MDRLLTKSQLADTFQVCPRTIDNWEERGIIHRAVHSPPRYDLDDCLSRHERYCRYKRKT